MAGSLSGSMPHLSHSMLDEYVISIAKIVRYTYPVVLNNSKIDPGLRLTRASWDKIEPAL